MKRIIFLSLVVLIAGAMSSCKKYEEGPAFSLRSKKARVANTWKIEKVMEIVTTGTIDVTSNYPADWKLVCTKDGKYTATVLGVSVTGTWAFDDKKEELRFSQDNSPTINVYKVLRLKEKELWMLEEINTQKTEFHLKGE